MEIRNLREEDAEQFAQLIINMYSHLDNLEWFTPMPYDVPTVKSMITNPRFYIIGAFIDEKLVGVSSLDYKCGKLIGKIEFPNYFDTSKLVEIGFNLVHYDYRGNKIMQQLIKFLLDKIKSDGFKHVFVKVHKDNIASNKSCYNMGFQQYSAYYKSVNKIDFYNLATTPFFYPDAKNKAMATLSKFENNENIIVDYNILTLDL